MADITQATTGYPAVIDTRTTLTDGSSGDEIQAIHVNGPDSAILAIETELGTDPAGSATDLKTRLAVAHNDAGVVTLGTAASLVGLLPFNRGGLGQTVASATVSDGHLVGFANSVLQPVTLTGSNGITAAATSGTWTISLNNTAKLSGDVVQMLSTQVVGFTTTNGTRAIDNTPITSIQGSDFGLTVNILPTATANTLYAQLNAYATSDGASQLWAGLFLAGSSSAVAATLHEGLGAGEGAALTMLWKATTVSTATTSYTVRIGAAAGTTTLNGEAGAGLFNNSISSTLMVWEVKS